MLLADTGRGCQWGVAEMLKDRISTNNACEGEGELRERAGTAGLMVLLIKRGDLQREVVWDTWFNS